MAITIKHAKTDTIADWTQADLDAQIALGNFPSGTVLADIVLPSDWNNDHTLSGTVPIANGGTGQTTANAAINALLPSQTSQSGKVLSTDGTNTSWTAVGGSGTVTSVALTAPSIFSVAGSPITASGTLALTYSGTALPVANGGSGATTLTGYVKGNGTSAFTASATVPSTDITGLGTMSTQNANSVTITGGTVNGTTIGATTATTGAFTTLTASTSLTTPTVQATNSGGLSLKNSAGTTQMSMGAGGGDNISLNVSTNLNGSNAQIDISPTGTGHVHINPTGSGSIQVNPTSVGTIDNMTIGATTPKNGSFVDFSVTGTTSFDGSQGTVGQVLTSAGTGATPTWTTPAAGTVTSVTGTAPVVSSGGATPAISMAAASSTVNGYLTSTDWTTFNNKGSGTVTSVSATSPVTSTGGATPTIAIPAATTSASGYLTSTDWNTFNGKGSGTVTSVAALTLGTTGTDLSSTVATGTTTPVITLQVPTASASNRGALSAADWTTFNNKGSGTVTSASVVSANGFAGTVATATTTPAITISTSITGVLKGNGTAISAATSGTDYSAGTSALATGIVKSTTTTGALSIAVSGTDFCAATSGSSVLKGSSGNTTAATAGTDYVAPGTATTFTAAQTFNGSSSVLAAVFANAAETTTIAATAATGTINYDVTTQSVIYYTSNASANWTVNFRASSGTSLNTAMATGQSVTVVFLVTQGTTAYYNNAVTIDGNSVTPKYQGGTAWSAGNASGIDAYSYTIVKTGSAAFTVFASQTQFK